MKVQIQRQGGQGSRYVVNVQSGHEVWTNLGEYMESLLGGPYAGSLSNSESKRRRAVSIAEEKEDLQNKDQTIWMGGRNLGRRGIQT